MLHCTTLLDYKYQPVPNRPASDSFGLEGGQASGWVTNGIPSVQPTTHHQQNAAESKAEEPKRAGVGGARDNVDLQSKRIGASESTRNRPS